MFSNIIFLAIALLIATMGPETSGDSVTVPQVSATGYSASVDFLLGMSVYAIVLVLIVVQNCMLRARGRQGIPRLLFIANIELLSFLAIFYFYFAGGRMLLSLPFIGQTLAFQVLFTLTLYFLGLALFYFSAYPDERNRSSRLSYVLTPLRFLMPFAIPFVVFSILSDVLSALTSGAHPTIEWIVGSVLSLTFIVGMLIFFPPLLTYCWGCQHLPDGPTRDRLQSWCDRAKFRHAGMLTWPVMGRSLTAAIIGPVARFRYVIFTPTLLEQLSPHALDAVLVHEMGHTRRKHLLIYPFILMGAMVIIGMLSLTILPAIDQYLVMRNYLNPTGPWQALQPFVVLLTYVLVISLYFRFVFGFYSRLFERQADLSCFDVGMPPQDMSDALNEVGFLSGNIHDLPSWHHYSIRQRMQFLEKAEQDPRLVSAHHRFVHKAVWGYFILLVIGITLLSVPLSLDTIQNSVDTAFNEDLRHDVALQFITSQRLVGDPALVTEAIEYTLHYPGALEVPGVVEVYAARILYRLGEYPASAQLMTLAWQRFNFSLAKPEAYPDFVELTQSILKAIDPNDPHAKSLEREWEKRKKERE